MPLPEPRPLTLEVRAREQLTPLVTRVVVGGDDLRGFEYEPGQDLMLAVPVDGATINRRYTIRRADPSAATVDLDLVVHGDGPGARWAGSAPIGSTITAVGPRGKIVPADDADWHLFVCDESGWAATAAMAEALGPGRHAELVVDVAGEEEHQAIDAPADRVSVSWCNRDGDPTGRAEHLLAALERVELPAGRRHAYLSAEFAVVRAVGTWLAERGFSPEEISPKAYWRAGRANAAHGEPLRDA